MIDRKKLHSGVAAGMALLALCLTTTSRAAAQDIRGLEACMAEKQMERRTGCLQANVELLQQTQLKQARDMQTKLAAANADIAALKARLTKLDDDISKLKAAPAKPEPAKK